jgi:hypothetical protein
MPTLDLTHPAILKLFGRHAVKGGTESRAFLAWFLENYYRLEDTETYDSVCDGRNDKGIDGIYVNEQLQQIDIFQVTIAQAAAKTLGDTKLKEFSGTIAQFADRAKADKILKTANKELQAIAKREDLLKRIEENYEVRGVFVTNANVDTNGTMYLSTQPNLILYDGLRLKNEFVTIDKTDPIATEFSFDVSGIPTMPYSIGTDLNMIIAPLLAAELVGMDGIANGDLFAWNVRQWLGRKTTVNKSVAASIQTSSEHKYFPAFHNGITILCKSLKVKDSKITIAGYAVVNGCQSITSLYDNKKKITSDLRILTKVIEIAADTELARKITDHTNNQNGTTARDLQSNNPVQTRLQTEIHEKYPKEFYYRIKRGEHPEWPKERVIENELIARILLAFDLNKPETWSQNYKLFDDLHGEIFGRPEVTADRVVYLFETYHAIYTKLDLLDDKLFADYTLTRWLVLYLVREALLTDDFGRKLYDDPSSFLSQPNGRKRLKECMSHIAQNIVRLLNGDVNRRKSASEYFDYKKELKNRDYISGLRSQLIPQYQIVLDSGHTESFQQKWDATNASVAT